MTVAIGMDRVFFMVRRRKSYGPAAVQAASLSQQPIYTLLESTGDGDSRLAKFCYRFLWSSLVNSVFVTSAGCGGSLFLLLREIIT